MVTAPTPAAWGGYNPSSMYRAGRALCLLVTITLLGVCAPEEAALLPTPNPPPPTVARPSLASPSGSPSPLASPTVEGQTYIVQTGDTLSSIAQRFYGDANEWRPIFEANRDRLTSAEALQVGMSLRIPPRQRP